MSRIDLVVAEEMDRIRKHDSEKGSPRTEREYACYAEGFRSALDFFVEAREINDILLGTKTNASVRIIVGMSNELETKDGAATLIDARTSVAMHGACEEHSLKTMLALVIAYASAVCDSANNAVIPENKRVEFYSMVTQMAGSAMPMISKNLDVNFTLVRRE